MTSQLECLEALAAGKTLTNGQTHVHLDSFGAQVHTGYKSKHIGDYSFDNPEYWHIIEPPRYRNSNPLFWVTLLFLNSLMVNGLLYTDYTNFSEKYTQLQHSHAELVSEYNTLSKELESYRVTQQQLEDLGATPEQAHAIIQASELYDLDPKH